MSSLIQRAATLAPRLALTAIAVAAIASSSTIAAAQDAKSNVMKLATATLNDTQHEWMKRFAVEIAKVTQGKITAEVYPASQLGSIPRQIEGTQLGSIQGWIGPPEFLVGLDARYELLSAPGLFKDVDHAIRTIKEPAIRKAYLALGGNKGLVGGGLFYSGPMAFDMRQPFKSAADLKGKKIRVLASPFQTEQVARIGGTGIPMALGDVLPALQQGTLDGAMSTIGVFTALQYFDAAKYMAEVGQCHVFSVAVFSKRWMDALAPDLKAAVLDVAKRMDEEMLVYVMGFLVAQRKVWVEKGGDLIKLPDADIAEIKAKTASVGEDIVKTKPELKPLWDEVVAGAKRTAQ